MSFEQAVTTLLPDGCATAYPYYSLALERGTRGVPGTLAELLDRSVELSADLPQAVLDDNAFYSPVATTTAQEERRVERSVRPTVAGLAVLAGAAAAITVIVLGLVVAREARRSENDLRQWWHLGATTLDRAVAVLVPILVAVVIGVALALCVAWLLSPVAPTGLVRSIDPSPSPELTPWAWLATLGLGVALVAVAAALAVLAARRVRVTRLPRRDVRLLGRVMRGTSRPEVDEGLRAAYGGGLGTGLVVASGALATGLFLAATIFSTSLFSVLSTPASYGWPWDVGLLGGAGYGEVDLDAARPVLDERDDIARWTGLGFISSLTVDGEPTLGVVALDEASDVEVTVVEGQLPAGSGEVALGGRTAADLGVDVGDEVEVEGDGVAPHRARVTGMVVLPALGPLEADRTGPGTGMLLSAASLDDDAAANIFSFVGIDVAPGADAQALLADVGDEFPSWDPFGEAPIEFASSVRPAEIVNAESMQSVPVVVGTLLVGTAVVGLVVALVVSVRSRRRELAVLRVLGFTSRQLRRSVRVQTVATMAGALVVGVPLGIVIGRVAWRLFAVELGIVTDPSMPIVRIASVVVAALVVAVVAAAFPARVASRTQPAVALRSE